MGLNMNSNEPKCVPAGATSAGQGPENDWRAMSPDERKRALFNKQKDLLDTFLSNGAIDRRQYEKSLSCMAEKMVIELNKSEFNKN